MANKSQIGPAQKKKNGIRTERKPRAKSNIPILLEVARKLRKNQTPAEQKLWMYLRNKRLKGIKFKRQHPLNKFIADFYCHEAGLVIELDGSIHLEQTQTERDKARSELINSLGIEVLRFNNSDIMNDLDHTLEIINDKVASLLSKPLPLPLSRVGEG